MTSIALKRTSTWVATATVGLVTLIALGCEKPKKATPTTPKKVEVKPAVAKEMPTAKKEAPKSFPDPFLYKIDGPNGPVYLLGTIHVAVHPKKDLSPVVWKSFDASTRYVMETDTTKAQGLLVKNAVQPKGQSLKKQLGAETWKKLDKLLSGRASQYNQMKSWMLITVLLIDMLPADADRSASMDGMFLSTAKNNKKEVGYLESPELQLSVLEKTLTPKELGEMINDYDNQKKELAEMIDGYKKGDEKTIIKASFKDLEKEKTRYELLFFKRNEAWIPKIKEEIKRGNTFIAVGAGHLYGDRGVLKLLEKEGYKATRVKDSK